MFFPFFAKTFHPLSSHRHSVTDALGSSFLRRQKEEGDNEEGKEEEEKDDEEDDEEEEDAPLNQYGKIPSSFIVISADGLDGTIDLEGYEKREDKGVANGYCPLDENTKGPSDNLSLTSADPIEKGVASAGTSTEIARADHIHPTDTTRAADNAWMCSFAEYSFDVFIVAAKRAFEGIIDHIANTRCLSLRI